MYYEGNNRGRCVSQSFPLEKGNFRKWGNRLATDITRTLDLWFCCYIDDTEMDHWNNCQCSVGDGTCTRKFKDFNSRLKRWNANDKCDY